jgi:hypothetical protein
MEIVDISSKRKDLKQEEQDEQKKAMLAVIDFIKAEIESGEIKEFVACSLGREGIAQIHVAAMDLPGSVGLFEIGKHLLIAAEAE